MADESKRSEESRAPAIDRGIARAARRISDGGSARFAANVIEAPCPLDSVVVRDETPVTTERGPRPDVENSLAE